MPSERLKIKSIYAFMSSISDPKSNGEMHYMIAAYSINKETLTVGEKYMQWKI